MRSSHRVQFGGTRFIASLAFIPAVLDVAPMGLKFRTRIVTDDINVVPTKILPLVGHWCLLHCDEQRHQAKVEQEKFPQDPA